MRTIKLRTKAPIANLHAMRAKDAFLTATFTDIKVLPFSGVIRYFGEFWDYDETGSPIEGTKREEELFLKREDLPNETIDQLFTNFPVDFTQGTFSANLQKFAETAFIQKVVADGRYGLTIEDVELITEE